MFAGSLGTSRFAPRPTSADTGSAGKGGGQIGCKSRLGEALSARTDLTRHGQALLVGFVCTIDPLVLLGLPAEALDRASRSKRVELPVSRMLPCGPCFSH